VADEERQELEFAETELDLAIVEVHLVGVEIDAETATLVDFVRAVELRPERTPQTARTRAISSRGLNGFVT